VWEGGGGPFLRLEVALADGTRVTIVDAPGPDAVQVLVIEANGHRVTDVTLRRGPSGDNSSDETR
jgi:hypothetical protein